MPDNTNHSSKKYIVTNEHGEEFLLPKYAATFRILIDDKDTIRDVLNSLLQLDHEREMNDALTTKRANYLRSQNVPDSVISTMLSLK